MRTGHFADPSQMRGKEKQNALIPLLIGLFANCYLPTAGRADDAPSHSVKTTDCTPEISNRLRQRMFLQAIRSSLRSM